MPRPRVILPLLFALLIAVLGPRPAVLVVGGTHPVQRSTPARPAAQTTPKPNWLPADKQGFGTSRTLSSKVWFTLEGGGLSEVYYPRLDTPSFRDLRFAVDGVPESGGSVHQVTLADPSSLTYRQVNTDAHDGWRLTKTYVTDPSRSTVLMHVQFQSLDGRRHRVAILADAAPSNETDPTPQSCSGSGVLASDPQMAIALAGRPAVKVGACSAHDGIVSSTTSTTLNGRPGHQVLALALGFAGTRGGALTAARASLRAGWDAVAQSYARGWHDYLSSLRKPPRSLATAAEGREYTVGRVVWLPGAKPTSQGWPFFCSP